MKTATCEYGKQGLPFPIPKSPTKPSDEKDVGFDVLTAVAMKSSGFWDITPCSLLKISQRFGETCRLQLQVEE
jgi:hypothetical protein